MNTGNLEERISFGKFAIILLRIIYIIVFILCALLLAGKEYKVGLVFGILGLIIVVVNVFMKSFLKKLEKIQYEQNLEFQQQAAKSMDEKHRIADEINKTSSFEIDESKIILSECDKKRIKKNCDIMKKKGLPYEEEIKLIPFDSIVQIKTKEEIAKQMIEEFIIAHKAVNRLQGISDIEDQDFVTMVLKYQPNQNVLSILSRISNGEIDQFTLTQLTYLYERVNVYMWVLGLGSKPLADKICYPLSITLALDKYSNFENLLDSCKMRSYDEIMEYADLITRYEWAVIELDRNGKSSKKINRDSVAEQKIAMNWVTSFNQNVLISATSN